MMIHIPTSVAALAAALGFYVYDSSIMLLYDEGIITSNNHAWQATINCSGLSLLGKKLFIPNLLFPHQPIFILSWSIASLTTPPTNTWRDSKAPYHKLYISTYIALISIFVITPAMAVKGGPLLVFAILLGYMSSFTTGVIVVLLRRQFHLDIKKALSIFCECALCPPLGLNTIRKISSMQNKEANYVAAAYHLLAAKQWDKAKLQLIHSIDERIAQSESDDDSTRLERAKSTLLSMHR